jgi:hypothetical protein
MDLNKQTLEELYLQQELSDRQIAERLNVPYHRIRFARKALGIPSRPRGHNLTGDKRPAFDQGSIWRGKTRPAATRQKISAAAQAQTNRPSGQFHPYFGAFGAANPNYKTGESDERARIYSTYEWRVIIEYVYLRDAGECQRCGTFIEARHKQRHHHHIASWADFPELRLDVDNVILLCRQCHEWIHSAQNTDRHFLIGVKLSD